METFRANRRILFFLYSFLGATMAVAQGSNGTVVGRLVDGGDNPLYGAWVEVVATSIYTPTDVTGRFRLTGVPAGEQTLRVSYLGLESQEARVVVRAGEVVRHEVTLDTPMFGEMMRATSESWLEGQAKALNQQKTARNIINVVAADQIGRFPDPNAADAMQRIPGITLQRDQGEGRYVVIRGTEARLNSMMINGERIPSPEGNVRQVALDVIPADLLEAIEVSKALTADMDGDAIGGAVNLVTKRAPQRSRLTADAGWGYSDQVDDDSMTGKFTYGGRLGPSKSLGLLLSVSALDHNRGADNFEAEYDDGFLDDFQLRDYVINRDRTGLNLDLDRRLSDKAEIFFHGLWNDFDDQEFRRRHRSRIGRDRIQRSLKDRLQAQEIMSALLGANHVVGNSLLFDWRLSYSSGDEAEPDRLDITFRQDDVEFAPNVTPDSIDPNNIRSNPLNEDLNQFYLDDAKLSNNFASEEDLVAALDLSLPIQGARTSGTWQFGAKYRHKNKYRDNNAVVLEGDNVFLVDFLDSSFDPNPFLDGRYDVGQHAEVRASRDLIRRLEGGFDVEEDLADYDASEDTAAAYGMAELHVGGPLSFLGGLRIESTDAEYQSVELQFDEAGDFVSLRPLRGRNSYDELLPSAHLRYALRDDSNLRLAVTRSLARPNFSDLAPFQLILDEDLEIERGNPALDVTTSWNFDILFERYYSTVGVFSAGLFYKSISDSIFLFRSEELRGGEEFEVTQPRNGGDAEIQGLEVAFQNRLRNGPLGGLGIYFNYTFVDSEARIPGRADRPRFSGQAESVGNLALSFERKGFSGRLSLNHHGDYILEVGGGPAEDVYIDDHTQLDFTASQRLSSHLRIYVDLLNLTDEPVRLYQAVPSRPIQEEYYSFWGTIGLKLDF